MEIAQTVTLQMCAYYVLIVTVKLQPIKLKIKVMVDYHEGSGMPRVRAIKTYSAEPKHGAWA
jgi:hypothetical protein